MGENQSARSASVRAALATAEGRLTVLRPAVLAGCGLLCFHLSSVYTGLENGLWLPLLAIGIALVAWLGFWALVPLWLDLFVVRLGTSGSATQALVDSSLLALEMGASWWCYHSLGRGARRVDDPRSAMLFLLLVPGVLAAGFATLQALCWRWLGIEEGLWPLAGNLWRAQALGILVPLPPLLVVLTPVLLDWGAARGEAPNRQRQVFTPRDWTLGETIEVAGLTLAAGILDIALAILHVRTGLASWQVWGLALLVIVWAGLRQGLRGGAVAAGSATLLALVVAAHSNNVAGLNVLQGHLLAQCSTALLVGASSGWMQMSEARYRQVIGHLPLMLYSVRVPRWIPARLGRQPLRGEGGGARGEDNALVEFADITLVSPAAQQILGCAPEEVLGPFSQLLQRILPADRELLIAALAQLCLQKQPVTCEYRLTSRDRDGTIATAGLDKLPPRTAVPPRWLRDTMAPHYSPDGHLDGWEGIVEDITEQRALAHDLRRTTGMLHALIANLPTGVYFVQGPHGQPILVNNRARQLLGQREDLAAGLPHLSRVFRLHRADGSEYPWEELPVTRALKHGTSCMAEDIVVHRADGRLIPLISWAAPVDLGVGSQAAAVWVLEDLSSLRQAEAARQEHELRLRAVDTKYHTLVDSLPLMVLQFDGAGQLTFLNSATEQILGYSAGELMQPGFFMDRILPEDNIEFRNALERTLQGQVSRVDVRFRARDDTLKVGYALLQPYVHDQKTAGSTCLVVDMTHQHHLEEELRRAQRLELIGRLAGGTIHDFNNLLTVMMGLAALARTALTADHPARHDVERILEVGEQAAHLVGQLLAFSKERRLEPQPVDLNHVVVHTLKLLQGSIPENIVVEQKLAPGSINLRGDETQLKQVLMNLVLNARDAMSAGGTLAVETEILLANGATETHEPHLRARLTVRDTGQGMDDHVRGRIFEPFFSTKERGTGLGLAVVQQIVESHGGRIDVHSEPRQGTCFEVWLPLANGS